MMHWYWRALYTRECVRLAFWGIQVGGSSDIANWI
jgi:hypothetical protein